jgi:predicted DNA-binding ribbon-helix-helix protein
MLKKRSLTIAGHRTSISLEEEFWAELKAAAEAEGKSLARLVAEIDEARTANLSSALRVWVLKRLQQG